MSGTVATKPPQGPCLQTAPMSRQHLIGLGELAVGKTFVEVGIGVFKLLVKRPRRKQHSEWLQSPLADFTRGRGAGLYARHAFYAGMIRVRF